MGNWEVEEEEKKKQLVDKQDGVDIFQGSPDFEWICGRQDFSSDIATDILETVPVTVCFDG